MDGELLTQVLSPDGMYKIEVYLSAHEEWLGAYVEYIGGTEWIFPFGYPTRADRIEFRWDLPNEAWGILIDRQCWAFLAYRPALRHEKCRMYSRTDPHEKPFSDSEIRYACARKRFQRKGTHGGVLEE